MFLWRNKKKHQHFLIWKKHLVWSYGKPSYIGFRNFYLLYTCTWILLPRYVMHWINLYEKRSVVVVMIPVPAKTQARTQEILALIPGCLTRQTGKWPVRRPQPAPIHLQACFTLTQYKKSYPMIVPNFKILGPVIHVPEKFLMGKS